MMRNEAEGLAATVVPNTGHFPPPQWDEDNTPFASEEDMEYQRQAHERDHACRPGPGAPPGSPF